MRPNTSRGLRPSSDVRPEPEPLHHAGAEALDQRVGFLGQRQHQLGALGGLEVDRNRGAAASGDVGPGGAKQRRLVGAIQPDHVGAHVGQQHRGERPRADARHLDDPDALQGTHGGASY